MNIREPLGERIGRLRTLLGWTQHDLADRLAASRVAVSHFEAGLALPSERTVVLLAGLFGYEPLELVEGTDYPMAKAERLPACACRYTKVDLQIELYWRDHAWVKRFGESFAPEVIDQHIVSWRRIFLDMLEDVADRHERAKIETVLKSFESNRS